MHAGRLRFCLDAFRFQSCGYPFFAGNFLRSREDFCLELITSLFGGNAGGLQLLLPLPEPVFPAHWRGPCLCRHAQAQSPAGGNFFGVDLATRIAFRITHGAQRSLAALLCRRAPARGGGS